MLWRSLIKFDYDTQRILFRGKLLGSTFYGSEVVLHSKYFV